MKTEAEKQLATLVSMRTITDDSAVNEAALDYIEDYLTKRSMHCVRDRFDGHGTLVASTRPDNAKTAPVLLHAHTDVMSASDEMFTLRQEGDKLIGRGVYDMKHAIAGYMQLVDELRDNLEDYDFAIMITTDEEYGSRDGINGAKHLVARGYRPMICISPDSTAPGWEVEKLAKGFWRFDLISKGRTAHGSRPWEGESASFKLIEALREFKQHFKDQAHETDVFNIGAISGGENYNQLPSQMIAKMEIRLLDKASVDTYRAMITELCTKYNLEYQDRSVIPPIKTDFRDPYVADFMDSIETVTGKRPKGYISGGQSDAPYFVRAGIQCILTCPEGGGHHSESEWISRESFLKFVPILYNYLEKTAKRPFAETSLLHLDEQPVAV